MYLDTLLIIIAIGLCVLVITFTSALDTALASISRHRLNAMLSDNGTPERPIARLTNDPNRMKATIILVNAAMVISATSFTLHLTRGLSVWLQAASLLLLLLIIFIFSGTMTKRWAIRNPVTTLVSLAGPFNLVMQLFSPLITLVNFLTRPLINTIADKEVPAPIADIEEELLLLMNAGEEEGLIEHNEREMIEGVFSFSDTIAREIMVPRVDIVALDINTSLEDALAKIITAGHSRIPVYQETIDTIVGILYAKDLLPALRDYQRSIPISSLLRKVRFVPETIKVDALLTELRQTKVHIAIVVDEYGGTAGLVTIEDVIEEIFGDIQDEYDVEEPPIQLINEREMIVDARVLIEEISELTNLDIESEESDRIGGLVYEKLGRIPEVDDLVVVNGATVKVLSVKGISPSKLHITFDEPPTIQSPDLLQKGSLFARSVNHTDNDLLTELLARESREAEAAPTQDTTNEPA